MPAIMTHDFFGRDVLETLPAALQDDRDRRDAFLLGNQGPDPLFYLAANPVLYKQHKLGGTMHHDKTAELISACKESLKILDDAEYAVGHAYVLGFLCHYTLDSAMHPLVYAHQYALCDAGVDGFTREDGGEVHGVIESEFDEMVLYTKKQCTIAAYSPAANILHGNAYVLRVIGKIYSYLALTVYGQQIPSDTFPAAVRSFRRVQALFYSPTGQKRAIISRIEQLGRPYSFFRSMSHRAIELEVSDFDNREHATWINPFTGAVSTKSFWDLYNEARRKAGTSIDIFDEPAFDIEAAHRLTDDLNFSGDPVEARLYLEPESE